MFYLLKNKDMNLTVIQISLYNCEFRLWNYEISLWKFPGIVYHKNSNIDHCVSLIPRSANIFKRRDVNILLDDEKDQRGLFFFLDKVSQVNRSSN